MAALALAAVFFANVYRTSRDISESEPRNYYAQGAAWMRTNIPAGQVVFNTDWDDFPRLFYFDSSHAYVSGLDPAYLHNRNAELRGSRQIPSGRRRLRPMIAIRSLALGFKRQQRSRFFHDMPAKRCRSRLADEECSVLWFAIKKASRRRANTDSGSGAAA